MLRVIPATIAALADAYVKIKRVNLEVKLKEARERFLIWKIGKKLGLKYRQLCDFFRDRTKRRDRAQAPVGDGDLRSSENPPDPDTGCNPHFQPGTKEAGKVIIFPGRPEEDRN